LLAHNQTNNQANKQTNAQTRTQPTHTQPRTQTNTQQTNKQTNLHFRTSEDFSGCKGYPLGFHCISVHFARCASWDFNAFLDILQGIPLRMSVDSFKFARGTPYHCTGFPITSCKGYPWVVQQISSHFARGTPLRISVEFLTFCRRGTP